MTFTNSAEATEEKAVQIQALKKLNTDQETASYLNVSYVALRQSRATGKLLGVPAPKHLKIGRSIRYKDKDIEAWIDGLDTITGEAA
ncbi:MAG: helix-turn-helix transcriptional regulator [Paraglaciecola sp.]